jgi:O-antigen/teichoic acid export membrane protein
MGRIISAFTGLLFIVMVARWLSPGSFGTWEVIVSIVTFSSYPVGLVAYWATRDVARGKMVGRTAMFAGLLLSALGLVIYFAFAFATYSAISAAVLPFLLGAVLVPLSYWSAVANAIVQGFRPGAYAYSLVVSELAKLVVAYEALYVYRSGIDGVLVALIAAYFVQSVLSTYFVRLTASSAFDFAQTRRWTRLGWIPLVSYLPTAMAVADTYVAAVGFGTTLVGYYQLAYTVASVVGYSYWLAFSLYPLLLRGGDERLPATSVEYSLLFAVPLAAGGFFLAGPILHLFGDKYLPGTEGLQILSVMFVFTAISMILDQTLLGTEKVDIGERPKFWDLIRSNLLFVPVVNILFGAVYVPSMYLALYLAARSGFTFASSVAVWALVQLATTVVFMTIKARRAKGYAKLTPGISVAYYLGAAAVMSGALYLASGRVSQSVGTLAYGVELLGLGVLGAAVYFGLVYAADPKFRDLARSLFRRL